MQSSFEPPSDFFLAKVSLKKDHFDGLKYCIINSGGTFDIADPVIV